MNYVVQTVLYVCSCVFVCTFENIFPNESNARDSEKGKMKCTNSHHGRNAQTH